MRYDLRSMIEAQLDRPRFTRPEGLPGETDAELRSRLYDGSRVPAQAILLPTTGVWPSERRSLTTSTGAGSIGTALADGDFISALRPKSVLGSLGAKIMNFAPTINGKVQVPAITAGSAVEWGAEAFSPTAASPTVGGPLFAPHSVAGRVSISRKLLHQSPKVLDQLILDLIAALAVAIDAAAISGVALDDESNPTGQPAGLLSASGLPTVALGDDGAALTRANLVALEKTVATANGDAAADASMGWLLNPATRAKLRLTENATGSGRYLYGDDDRILGKPAGVSTYVPSNLTKGEGEGLSAIIFGDWSKLGINLFTPPWIVIDPYRQSYDGTVSLTLGMEVDAAPLQLAAFAAALDVVTS
jgi:HK97 family phage major capsid protein